MILAIDLGTTYFKFTLFDRQGALLRTIRVTPHAKHPHSGWVELDAERFVAAIDEGFRQLLSPNGSRKAKLDAVTFATQTNSFLLLDDQDRPLTPIIIWSDARAREIGDEIAPDAGIRKFRATTGVPALNHEFMAAKIVWLQREQPALVAKASRLCLISDYLALLLTGRHVTEAGAAGLTGLIDIRQRTWWDAALTRFAIPKQWLPEIVDAGTDLGPVLPAMAVKHGVAPDCRFIVGTLDQYAGAIGVGGVAPGTVAETTGTVLAAVRCASGLSDGVGPNVFQGPAFEKGLYWRMAFGNFSANYFHWYRDQLPDRPEFDDLAMLAATISPGADGLRVDRRRAHPAEALEGYVHLQPRGRVVRGILEGVAYALQEHLHHLQDPAGDSALALRSAGGGSRSEVWLQIKADVLDLPVCTTTTAEPTSLGTAILAESALSHRPVAEIAKNWVRLQTPLQPNPVHVANYRSLAQEAGV